MGELLAVLKNRREQLKTGAQHRKGSAASDGTTADYRDRAARFPAGAVRVRELIADEPYELAINYLNWMMKNPWVKNEASISKSPTVRDTKEDNETVKGASMNLPSQSQMSMRFRFNVLETDYSSCC